METTPAPTAVPALPPVEHARAHPVRHPEAPVQPGDPELVARMIDVITLGPGLAANPGALAGALDASTAEADLARATRLAVRPAAGPGAAR